MKPRPCAGAFFLALSTEFPFKLRLVILKHRSALVVILERQLTWQSCQGMGVTSVNTVRVHRKLRQAGVVADLHVFEGQSHAQYAGDADAPETKEHFGELAAFFDRYLAK
jgi:acetyl esterase/lipase